MSSLWNKLIKNIFRLLNYIISYVVVKVSAESVAFLQIQGRRVHNICSVGGGRQFFQNAGNCLHGVTYLFTTKETSHFNSFIYIHFWLDICCIPTPNCNCSTNIFRLVKEHDISTFPD